MSKCETTDFIYPLLADVYYPLVKQDALGSIKKQWVLDRSVACSLAPAGSAMAEDVKPNVNITREVILVGRVRSDIRVAATDSNNAITNVLITNIRDKSGNSIYNETSGVRNNKTTLFEVATNEPIVGPFGKTEYFKLVLKRSENQAVDL
jgi:hypothetical protein